MTSQISSTTSATVNQNASERQNVGLRRSAGLVSVLLLMIVLPATLTLRTIEAPADSGYVPGTNPSPYGYTVSLLLWIVPLVVFGFWLIPHDRLIVPKKAFLVTVGLVFLLGAALDFLFAQFFFDYPNKHATLGYLAPALGEWVPVEEYFFYLTGACALILMYIWFDQYWLAAYKPVDAQAPARLIQFHPSSAVVALALIVAATLYRNFVVGNPGFPGYFIFLVLVALLPSAILFPAVGPMINWRAFTVTLMFVTLISVLWEATLGVPYGWWAYNPEQMVGIYIDAWAKLPLEAVILWMAVSFAGIPIYIAVRIWLYWGQPLRVALFGAKS